MVTGQSPAPTRVQGPPPRGKVITLSGRRTHALQNRLDMRHALVVHVVFSNEFDTVRVTTTATNKTSDPDRLTRVRGRELNLDLVGHGEFDSGKNSHPAAVQLGTTAFDDRNFRWALDDHPNGYIHFIAGPAPPNRIRLQCNSGCHEFY